VRLLEAGRGSGHHGKRMGSLPPHGAGPSRGDPSAAGPAASRFHDGRGRASLGAISFRQLSNIHRDPPRLIFSD